MNPAGLGVRAAASAAAFTLAMTVPLAAESLEVFLEWPRGKGSASAVMLRAASEQRDASGAPTVLEIEMGSDSGGIIVTPGLWTVTAHAPGFWSQPLIVPVRSKDKPVARVPLWPAASVSGRWTGEAEPPTDMELRFAPAQDDASGLPGGSSRCPVENGAWRCAMPAGTFDLELRPKGFVPRYEWGLTTGASTDLGTLPLRRGASLSGRVGRRDGSLPPGPCDAEIVVPPSRARLSGKAASGERTGRFTATVGARGFFQLIDVPPGEYPLTVTCPEARGRFPVTVEADTETRVPSPLVLAEGVLNVVLQPPVDPKGGAWRFVLFDPSAHRPPSPAPASPEGRWSFRGLPAGRYDFEVQASDGTRWRTGSFEWAENETPLSIDLTPVAVIGRVRLDERPLRARVTFTDPVGGTRLSFTTDSGGLFDGPLPQAPPGGWTVDIDGHDPVVHRKVHGIPAQPPPTGEKAWVDIALTGLALRGHVVEADGRPRPGAAVSSESAAGVRQQVITDDAGAFEIPIDTAAAYRLQAESASGSSRPLMVEVSDAGQSPAVRLVLEAPRRIVGHVVGPRGAVGHATVHTRVPPGDRRSSLRADASGRFEEALPAETTSVAVTVAAAGHPLRMTRLALLGEGPVQIPLSAAGGRLVVEAPATALSPTGTETVVLVHDGGLETVESLADWGTLHGGGLTGNRMVLPELEPGAYEACLTARNDLPRAWAGTLPKDQCRSGALEAGGQLVLTFSPAPAP